MNRELELATEEASEARGRALLAVRNPSDWERALGEALAAFKRADVIASQNPTLLNSDMSTRMAAMRRRLADDLKDRRFAERVDEIRLGVSDTYVDAGEYAFFNKEDAFPKVRDAIEKYFGLAFGTAGKDEVLRLIEKRPQPIQEILINALSECRRMAPKGEQTAIGWLNSVIDAAETDPWQERARAAVAARDWAGLERMLTGEDAASRPAARLLRLVALVPVDEKVARVNLLRRIQIAHPDDFWATYLLGYEIHQNYEWDEALRYLTAATALRPRSAGAQFQLGIALRDKGRLDEAIDRQREVLRLDPKNTLSRRELALVLKLKGKLDEAITEFREVLRLNPASYSAHYNLSSALLTAGAAGGGGGGGARGDPAQARLREPPWAAGVDLVPAGPACRGGDGVAPGARASWGAAGVSPQSDQCAACARESGRGQETLRRLGRSSKGTQFIRVSTSCTWLCAARTPPCGIRKLRRGTVEEPPSCRRRSRSRGGRWAGRTFAWASFTRRLRPWRNRAPCRKAGKAMPVNGSCWHSRTGSSRCGRGTTTESASSTRGNSADTTSKPAKKSTCGGPPGQATSWTRESGISARKQRKCYGSWRRQKQQATDQEPTTQPLCM